MVKWKKRIAIYLLMVVCMSAAAGCSGTGSLADPSGTKEKNEMTYDNSEMSSQESSDREEPSDVEKSTDADYEEGEISF